MNDIAPIGRPNYTAIGGTTRRGTMPTSPTNGAQRGSDEVQFSDSARLLSKLRELPDIRQDKIDQVRQAIDESQLVLFVVSARDGLTAEDFNFYVEAKGDEYVSVAHIQGITDDPEGSAWVKGYDPPLNTVPEPSTWLLMALGLVILPFARRLRRN